MEQVRGVEPLSLAWKAKVIPIYDTCVKLCRGTRIRTETKSSQTIRATITQYPEIYSMYIIDNIAKKGYCQRGNYMIRY